MTTTTPEQVLSVWWSLGAAAVIVLLFVVVHLARPHHRRVPPLVMPTGRRAPIGAEVRQPRVGANYVPGVSGWRGLIDTPAGEVEPDEPCGASTGRFGPVVQCDRLAGHPDDHRAVVNDGRGHHSGVSWTADACESIMPAHPEHGDGEGWRWPLCDLPDGHEGPHEVTFPAGPSRSSVRAAWETVRL